MLNINLSLDHHKTCSSKDYMYVWLDPCQANGYSDFMKLPIEQHNLSAYAQSWLDQPMLAKDLKQIFNVQMPDHRLFNNNTKYQVSFNA